ncbi:MAG: hypothetical protein HUU32_15385 [Calditrichaceae bacterium]|nr:hypothetical protein [Calditrichia bacterium]NUQ42769.1 hypothetical protein [Calditrichaceae bacterium]
MLRKFQNQAHCSPQYSPGLIKIIPKTEQSHTIPEADLLTSGGKGTIPGDFTGQYRHMQHKKSVRENARQNGE